MGCSAEYLSQAYGLRLDALSLRVRAVRAMLSIDAARAREMFGQMPVKLPLSAVQKLSRSVAPCTYPSGPLKVNLRRPVATLRSPLTAAVPFTSSFEVSAVVVPTPTLPMFVLLTLPLASGVDHCARATAGASRRIVNAAKAAVMLVLSRISLCLSYLSPVFTLPACPRGGARPC